MNPRHRACEFGEQPQQQWEQKNIIHDAQERQREVKRIQGEERQSNRRRQNPCRTVRPPQGRP